MGDIPNKRAFKIMFSGYVAQQYIQKTKDGEKRAVTAYENIMKRIPKSIKMYFIDQLQVIDKNINYEIGTIPNLYSLIPMAQTAHKPIFLLKAKDGVRGAHFNKVRDAAAIFGKVAKQLISNVEELCRDKLA